MKFTKKEINMLRTTLEDFLTKESFLLDEDFRRYNILLDKIKILQQSEEK